MLSTLTRKYLHWNQLSQWNKLLFSTMESTTPTGQAPRYLKNKPKKDDSDAETVVLTKDNIKQSPWKMRFLVTLIRDTWYPDAVAQMKFSPKIKSEIVEKILKRGAILAKLKFNAIPEELRVKEVIVTKGLATKRMRIMGRGRTGIGYKRRTHIRIVLEKINFTKLIEKQKTLNQKKQWLKKQKLVEDIKKNIITPIVL